MEKGIVQVYCGEGRGKTSAALGNAIKTASAGKTVYIVQFLKGQLDASFMDKLEPEIKIFRFERSEAGFDSLSEEEKAEEKVNFTNGLNFAKKALTAGQCDMLVLDEVLGVVEEGMATAEEIIEVLSAKGLFTDIILTGNNLPDAIRQVSDEVLVISKDK